MKLSKELIKRGSLALLIGLTLTGCASSPSDSESLTNEASYSQSSSITSSTDSSSSVEVPQEVITTPVSVPAPTSASIPTYSGNQLITLNNNLVEFDTLGTTPNLNLNGLDQYGRATGATAVLDASHQRSSESRTSIDAYVPGYQSEKVTFNGKTNWAYNRSHLVAYTLWSGDFTINGQDVNTNEGDIDITENLVAGTRQLNVGDTGMTEYEERIRTALERGDTVQYRVTPYYQGSELVPRGVQLEAKSNSLEFNVFIFNVGDGFDINYQDGSITLTSGSVASEPVQSAPSQEPVQAPTPVTPTGQTAYTTATGSKYHLDPNCRGLSNANSVIQTTVDQELAKGHELCGYED